MRGKRKKTGETGEECDWFNNNDILTGLTGLTGLPDRTRLPYRVAAEARVPVEVGALYSRLHAPYYFRRVTHSPLAPLRFLYRESRL